MIFDRNKRCPDRQKLADCLQPLASDSREMNEHLTTCASCRETLDSLAGDREFWADAGELLSAPDDPTVQRITESVCALSFERGPGAADDPLCDFEIEQLESLVEPASHPELLGRINRYELEQLIGRGGMGLVFRARDMELHRVVAVKTLAIHLIPIGAARERFIREARASAALVHPHIVPVHDVITEGPIPALVMQYVAGPTLEAWLSIRGRMGWQQVLQIGIQLADALAAAHAHGLIHRDIKPGNVLLEADGSRALLTDFGLVRTLDDASLTRSGTLAGTPDYMSPEQARGESVDQRSDLFSLGSLLYAMLAGHPPFRASDPMAVMNRICHERHRSLAAEQRDLPLEVCRTVDKLLAKDARHRFATAVELRDHLQRLAHSPLHLRRLRNHRRLAGLVAVAILVVVTSVLVFLSNGPGERSDIAGMSKDHSGSNAFDSSLNDSASGGTFPVEDAESLRSESRAAAESIAELRAFDYQLEQLDRQTRELLEGFGRSSPTSVRGSPRPLIEMDQQLRALTTELDILEQEIRQP